MSKRKASTKISNRRVTRGKVRKGELSCVDLVRPGARAKNIDFKAARKAAREYFIKHPRVLERA
jgi:hypothetical protein